MGGHHWAMRAHSAFDALTWVARLNLLWLAAVLCGAGVLGLGPATLAAHEVVRRRAAGDDGPLLPAFVAALRGGWRRGLALGLPLEAAWAGLAVNWFHFSAGRTAGEQAAAGGVAFAAVYLAAVTIIAFPLAARYDVPGLRALVVASRFVPRQLPGMALLLFVAAAVVFASLSVPGLIPFLSGGAWLTLTGHVAHRLFEANDALAVGPAEPGPHSASGLDSATVRHSTVGASRG